MSKVSSSNFHSYFSVHESRFSLQLKLNLATVELLISVQSISERVIVNKQMEKTASIIASLFLLTLVNGCKLGDICETSSKPGVVTVDKKCPFFTSLSGPEMVDHGFCGFTDPFKSETLVCCPTVNHIEPRLQPGLITVEDMCKSFEEVRGNLLGTRIIGGSRSYVGEFPHFAALGYKGSSSSSDAVSFLCGGSLISEKFVLTAAHCCKKSRMPVVVRLGKVRIFEFSLDFDFVMKDE